MLSSFEEFPIAHEARALPQAHNDNQAAQPPAGRSLFPEGVLARIHRPCRSAMTSGRGRTKKWILSFERRSPPWIEPLMGWTAGDDTLTQVSLSFPTVEAAIDYAERQGLPYTVDRDQRPSSGAVSRPAEPAADDAEPESRPGLPGLWLDEAYGLGVSVGYQPTTNAGDPRDWRSFASPLDVVASRLSIDEKRSILSDWWWHEYLLDMASAEGMPENQSSTRLEEVEAAILALDRPSTLPEGAWAQPVRDAAAA